MRVKDKFNNQKLIVNIPAEDLEIFEKASALDNRSRNNFILTYSKIKAREILQSQTKEDSPKNDRAK